MVFNLKKNRPWVEDLTMIMQFGLTMVGCILFCFLIGRYLDKWLDTPGIFVTIFIIFGIVGGAVTVYRQIMEKTEEERKDKRYPKDGEG